MRTKVYIFGFFIFCSASFSFSQKIGGSFGYHFTKWDIFEHCYDFEAYGEIPISKSKFFLVPDASIRLLTYNRLTGDSLLSTQEKFINILSVFSFGAGYSIASISSLTLKTAVQLGFIPFGNDYSIWVPDSIIIPAEIRLLANLIFCLEITLSSHLGIDIFPVLGYVSESWLKNYKAYHRGYRPFDSYLMFKIQCGIFYKFGSFRH